MIRAYEPKDKLPLLDLMRLNTPQYFHQKEEEDFDSYLNHKVENYYVLEEDGAVIAGAGINYYPVHGEAHITWDIIHPDFQGKGLGSQLIDHRIAEIRRVPGIHQVTVRTSQLAYPFYEKRGFELIRTVSDYWAPGFDLYEMRLRL